MVELSGSGGQRAGWIEAVAVYLKPKLLAMFFLGFAAGLPFLLYFSTLSFWLERSGVDVALIGFFSWFGLTYGLKFLWAPILDRFSPPGFGKLLGQRRGWILTAQIGIFVGLVGIGASNPAENLMFTAAFSLLTVFASATQDIGIDAWRIDIAKDDDEQAPLSAMYQAGYRVGMIMAGGGALFIAGLANWPVAYWIMGVLIFVGSATFIWAREPGQADRERPRVPLASAPGLALAGIVFAIVLFGAIIGAVGGIGLGGRAIADAAGWEISRGHIAQSALYVAAAPFIIAALLLPVIKRLPHDSTWRTHPATGPFIDFFWRYGWAALAVLVFISVYRLSDIVMGVMAKPLYSSMGYSEEVVGIFSGTMGPIVIMVGAAVGGISAVKLGLSRTLFIGAIIAVLGNGVFAWLAGGEAESWRLCLAILADNFAGGFAGTIFIAYLSILTNRAFTASQYALFSSMFMLMPKLVAGTSGVIVENVGYVWFFLFAAGLGLPAILMSPFMHRLKPAQDKGGDAEVLPGEETEPQPG